MLNRRYFAVALALAPLVLAGCGGDSKASSPTTLKPTQATQFVAVQVSTTTTLPIPTTLPFNPTQPTLPPTGTIPPSSLAAGATPSTPAGAVGTYTIKAGDSLSSIARKHGTTMAAIIAVNGWTDGTDHVLLPGATIKVNGASTTATTAAGSGSNTTTKPSGSASGCSYIILPNDNPSKVAARFGVTVAQLRAANPASVMNSFLVGATLKIPNTNNCRN